MLVHKDRAYYGNPQPPGSRGECFNWQKEGKCKYGDKCRYEHAGKAGGAQPKSNPQLQPKTPQPQPKAAAGADEANADGAKGEGKGKTKPVFCKYVRVPTKGTCPDGMAKFSFFHKKTAHDKAMEAWEAGRKATKPSAKAKPKGRSKGRQGGAECEVEADNGWVDDGWGTPVQRGNGGSILEVVDEGVPSGEIHEQSRSVKKKGRVSSAGVGGEDGSQLRDPRTSPVPDAAAASAISSSGPDPASGPKASADRGLGKEGETALRERESKC